jgi:cytochrome b561
MGYYMLLQETTGSASGAYWLVKALSCFLVLMHLQAALKHATTFSGGT